jgi:DNA-binding MarR family transcriptional regulator
MNRSRDITDQVLIALRRIVRAIDLHQKRLIQTHGMTTPQALILASLHELGEVSAGALAQRVGLSQATVSEILDRLERRGLIARSRSTADKRRVLVKATEAAAKALAGAPPLLQESFTAKFRKLEDWEQTLILSSLQHIAAMMDARDVDAAPVLSTGRLTSAAEDGDSAES